jgi:transcriptional regulator with XRE-family HTH domain
MEEPRLNRLSIVLDEFNLDQIDLAIILEVSKDTVSRWCRNANQPKLLDLYSIAKIFRIDIRRLIEPTDWSNETGHSKVQEYIEKKRQSKLSNSKKVSLKSKEKKK